MMVEFEVKSKVLLSQLCIYFNCSYTHCIRYGVGSGPILLTQVECDDNYAHLLHCSVVAFSHLINPCSHSDDVAVQCGELELATHV